MLYEVITFLACTQKEQRPTTAFPLKLEDLEANRKMSSAMERAFKHYEAPRLLDNELYSNFLV